MKSPIILAALILAACTGSLEQNRLAAAPPRTVGSPAVAPEQVARCNTLDDRRQFWGALGKGAAVLGGASGLSTLPLEDPKYETTRVGLAIGGVAAAAIAAGAIVISEGASESWARECSTQ